MTVSVIVVMITNGSLFYVNSPKSTFKDKEICELSMNSLVAFLKPQKVSKDDIVIGKCVPLEIGFPT